MKRKKAPRLAAAFVVTISAGCGGSTPPPQDEVPNLGSIDTKMYRDEEGKCWIQHAANPPYSEQVDCETQQPIKPEDAEKKPDETTPTGTDTPELPDAPAGWRVERSSDGTCTAFPPMEGCPAGMACNPPRPRQVNCAPNAKR